MSNMFNSSPSFESSCSFSSSPFTQQESDLHESSYNMEVLRIGLKNIQKKKAFKDIQWCYSQSSRYLKMYAFRKISLLTQLPKPHQLHKINLMFLYRKIAVIFTMSNQINAKQLGLNRLKQHMNFSRKQQLQLIQTLIRFCDAQQYNILCSCFNRINNSRKNIGEKQSHNNKKIKSRIMANKILKIIVHKKCEYFNSLKQHQRNEFNIKMTALVHFVDCFQKMQRRNYQQLFRHLKQEASHKELRNMEDDPSIMTNVVKHMCFLSSLQSEKSNKQSQRKAAMIKQRKLIKLTKLIDIKIKLLQQQFIAKLQRLWIEDKISIREKAHELESLKNLLIQNNQ